MSQFAINIVDIPWLKHGNHYEHTVAAPDIIPGKKEECCSVSNQKVYKHRLA